MKFVLEMNGVAPVSYNLFKKNMKIIVFQPLTQSEMEAMFRFYSFGSGDWVMLSEPDNL